METSPGFFARLWLALRLFFRLLADRALALEVAHVEGRAALPPPPPAAPPPREETTALQLLALLQREGRLIDFVQEDVASFSDAEVGAAARVVHEGCRKVLRESFSLQPVRGESEGAPVAIPPGFDAAEIRLTGNVVGQPPFRGRLAHHGWKVTAVRLPRPTDGWNAQVIAPAEVEL